MRQSKINSTTGSEIVANSEMKNYLRVDHNIDDTLISEMVTQSRQYLENYISRDIVAKTRTYYLDTSDGVINIPFGPVASIESVTVDGTAATHTVVGLDKETIELDSQPSYVVNNRLPGQYEKVKINYTTAGLADKLLKNSIMQMVSTLYDNRTDFKSGTTVIELPTQSKKLIDSYKSMFV
tara:strand:+ start:1649 stop:2191 length:543 start_codon:yes stop_codon:yes gene_type:complete